MDRSHSAAVLAKAAAPLHAEGHRYPGQGAHGIYTQRRADGLPVEDELWAKLEQLVAGA